jgi:hypothetical protein
VENPSRTTAAGPYEAVFPLLFFEDVSWVSSDMQCGFNFRDETHNMFLEAMLRLSRGCGVISEMRHGLLVMWPSPMETS